MNKLIICICTFTLILSILSVNSDNVSPSVSTESSPRKLSLNFLRKPLSSPKPLASPDVQVNAPTVKIPGKSPRIVLPVINDGMADVKKSFTTPLKSMNTLNDNGSFEFWIEGPNGSIRINGLVKDVNSEETLEISGIYNVGSLAVTFSGNSEQGFQVFPLMPEYPSLAPKAIRTIVG